MTYHLATRIGSAPVVATIVFAFSVVLTSAAMGQASPAPVPAAKATPASKPMLANTSVEARVKSLHDSLKITPAQEPQWQAVADVMRDNAKTTSGLIEERAGKTTTMTAIDDLHSYEAIAEAHVAGLKNLIPPVEALYATMSDAQKKNADAVFSHRPKRLASKK